MTLVLVANILVQLLLSAFDIGTYTNLRGGGGGGEGAKATPLLRPQISGSADEVLLVGLRNSSEGVVVSLVPSNGSLSLPISFLVPNYFVPPLCGTRSFRCGKPLALPAANVSLPIPAAQYLLLVPVTGAVLIADWRLAHSKMTLSGYAVKNVVGNECDPLSIMRATTTGTIYMVCLGETKLFLYTVNVNSTSVGSSTIPGHLLEYDFFQPPNLLSNFIYNGLTLLYFFEGNILYVLDLQYYQLIDYQMPLPACDAPYRSTAVGLGTSMKIVANCEASNTSAIIDINAENVNLVSGLVYPCTEDISTWFHIYQLSNAMRVETSRYNASSTANGVVFHSAVCVIGMDFTLLVTLVYVISEAAFQIAIFDGNVVSSTLSQAVGCAPSGCGLEVFSQCLLTTGGDALVFCVQNGSIGLDPVIDQNQFDSVFNVLFRIPTDAPTTTVLPSGSSSHGNPSPSGTTIPSKVQNGTTIIAVVVSVLVVMVVVVVVVVVAVMVAVKKKRRNFNW